MKLSFTVAAAMLLFGTAVAEDQLPIQRPVSLYSEVWENCPFNREVVQAVEAQISSTFGKNLTLDGLSHDSIMGPIAYIRDLADNQPMMVTQGQSESHPYTIVTATESNDPREAKVTITNGQEVAEISYQANMMTQKIEQPSAPPSGNGAQAGAAASAAVSDPQGAQGANTNSGNAAEAGNTGESASGQPETPRRRRILLPNRGQN